MLFLPLFAPFFSDGLVAITDHESRANEHELTRHESGLLLCIFIYCCYFSVPAGEQILSQGYLGGGKVCLMLCFSRCSILEEPGRPNIFQGQGFSYREKTEKGQRGKHTRAHSRLEFLR